MAGLTKQKSLFLGLEPTFGATPASMLAVPAQDLGEVLDQKEILETAYATGRPFRTPHIVSDAEMWSLSFSTPTGGLLSAAGDGTNASSVADDWLDLLFLSALGPAVNLPGEGVTSGTGSTVVADTDVYAAQDLVCLANATRAQWRQIASDAGATYTVAPDWTTAPDAADVLYGIRRYWADPSQLGGGHPGGAGYLRAHLVLPGGLSYSLQGGYVSACKAVAEINKPSRLEWTLQGVRKRTGLSPTLPDAISAPALTPIQLRRASVHFGATAIDTSKIELDLGLSVQPLLSSDDATGIAGWQTTEIAPTVSLSPLYDDALMVLRRSGAAARLILQLGEGALTGGVLNTMGVCLYQGQISAADPADEAGLRRNAVTIVAADPVTWAAGVPSRLLQIARA